LTGRWNSLYQALDARDAVEILLLTLIIYVLLRLVGAARGAGLIRGLGVLTAGSLLVVQIVVAVFGFTELGVVLDYLLATTLLGLVVVFQPELRRGLLLLGKYPLVRALGRSAPDPMVDRLAEAAEALSRDFTGALIAIQREVHLANYINTGERLDAELSPRLLRAIFNKRSPLHDGAVIVSDGRIAAAACQLPLVDAAEAGNFGMRHRAALGLSEETDAIVIVVSEETGRISLAVQGRLEPVTRETLARRLVALLSGPLALAA